MSDLASLVSMGFAVCEVSRVLPDGSCSCRLGDECESAGKHPVGRGWLRSAVEGRRRRPDRVPAVARLAPATSYGLIPMPGSGLIVIDRDDPDVLLPMPETFEVHRASADPRKGHYYFRLADGIAESDVPRSFSGGEVRVAASGHVVGPGCRHVSGDLYEPNGADVGIADRDLIDALSALRPVRRGADGEVEAVVGSRHDFLVRQARKLAGWSWGIDRIADELRTLNEELCQPPLSEKEGEFDRMAAWAATNIRPDVAVSVHRSRKRGPDGRLRRPREWEVVRHA